MNFEQLEYIKKIIDVKSMSVAAGKLFVTQSAISQSISLLEKELGVQLFKRSRNGTIPTKDGLWIIPKLMEILQKSEQVKIDIQSKMEQFAGDVTINTISGIFMTLLPEALVNFKKDFPLVHYKIAEMENEEVIKSIEQEKADIGFITLKNKEKLSGSQLEYQSIHQEIRFYLLVSTYSRFANYTCIQMKDILDEPFILYGEQFYRKLLEDYVKKSGQIDNRISIIFQSNNPEVVKKSVSADLGVSIVSKLLIEDCPYVESGRIKVIPIVEEPFDFTLSFGVIYNKNNSNYKLIQELIDYCRREIINDK